MESTINPLPTLYSLPIVGVNLFPYFFSLYNVRLDYEELIELGLLNLNNNKLYIPEDKWYISNDIIIRLLEGVRYE